MEHVGLTNIKDTLSNSNSKAHTEVIKKNPLIAALLQLTQLITNMEFWTKQCNTAKHSFVDNYTKSI